MGKTAPNAGHGCLEARPVVFRPRPDDHPAVRTAVPSQQKRLIKAIKVGGNKPMTPEPPPTARTLLESRPGKAPAQVKNLLDAGFNEQYQESVGFVGSSPHGFGAKGALTLFAPFYLHPQKSLSPRLRIIQHSPPSGQQIPITLPRLKAEESKSLHLPTPGPRKNRTLLPHPPNPVCLRL
jgi:hypothetical protein